MRLRSFSHEGFTLVELMVVVAIIGVLAAVAVPNFQRFQAKARQIEAKSGLSAIQSLELAFATDAGTFTGCFMGIGYVNNNSSRYYVMGFANNIINAPLCGAAGNFGCNYLFSTSGTVPVFCNINGVPNAGPTSFGGAYTSSQISATTKSGSAAGPADAQLNAASTGTTGVATYVSSSQFTLGAVGSISNNSNYDVWHISETGGLVNDNNGL
ncbi:MAG: type II secretion system protein [Bdellovibrionia bacterium]